MPPPMLDTKKPKTNNQKHPTQLEYFPGNRVSLPYAIRNPHESDST